MVMRSHGQVSSQGLPVVMWRNMPESIPYSSNFCSARRVTRVVPSRFMTGHRSFSTVLLCGSGTCSFIKSSLIIGRQVMPALCRPGSQLPYQVHPAMHVSVVDLESD